MLVFMQRRIGDYGHNSLPGRRFLGCCTLSSFSAGTSCPSALALRWKNILQAWPFAVTGVVNAIYFPIDVVIIGLFLIRKRLGYMSRRAGCHRGSIGCWCCNRLRAGSIPFGGGRLSPASKPALARSVIFAGGLIASGGFLLAPEIIHLLFGSGFAGAEQALRILMINLAATHVRVSPSTDDMES